MKTKSAPTASPAPRVPALLSRLPRRALDGYGRAVASSAAYAEPASVDELRELLAEAQADRVPVALRGAGRSYGDPALNAGGVVLGLTKLDRLLAWDAERGLLDVEAGVSLEQIWRHALPLGYWPPVVSGTMAPTVGGALAMNIHGKNNFRAGPIGEHVHELELLTPSGERMTCSREQNADVFRATIGGFGMLGVLTRARIALKRIESGYVDVNAFTTPNLEALFESFPERSPGEDYFVGWVDAFARGKQLGRAAVHTARYVPASEAPDAAESLTLARQDLPSRFFGVIPRGLMWRLMAPWTNDPGMRLINFGKFNASRLQDGQGRRYRQSLVAFQFLLDYVPRWRESYGRAGFIQVQPFVPAAQAPGAFRRILALCQSEGLVPYLAVFKRHRPDEFLLTHAVDGYSMAMDFRVTDANRARMWTLGQAIGDIVVDAGGRFYFAKDAVARPDQVARAFGPERIAAFRALKERLDPAGVLSSELSRRVMPDLPVIG